MLTPPNCCIQVSRSVRIGAQTQSSVSTSAARNALPVLARP
jgi:hypothetical protein